MVADEIGLAASGEGPVATAYVPRLLPAWAAAEPGPAHRVVDGSLLMFDITGFTPLTERLARRGREGAEELSNLLDTVFSQLLTDAEDEGADLLKWGGDALLLLFDGPDHGRRAARGPADAPGSRPVWTPPRRSAGSSCVPPQVSSLVQFTSYWRETRPCTGCWFCWGQPLRGSPCWNNPRALVRCWWATPRLRTSGLSSSAPTAARVTFLSAYRQRTLSTAPGI